MATSYTDISYATTTYYDTASGYGIMCDNTDIYCDNVEYNCDGSRVKTDIAYTTTTCTDISYP